MRGEKHRVMPEKAPFLVGRSFSLESFTHKAKSVTVTVTVSFSSSPPIPKKGKEKFYIYIYIYKYNYLIILFSHFGLLEGKVAENKTVTVTVTLWAAMERWKSSTVQLERVLSCLCHIYFHFFRKILACFKNKLYFWSMNNKLFLSCV